MPAGLDQLALSDGIEVRYRSENGGKGAAVKSGLNYAEARGYTHVLQVMPMRNTICPTPLNLSKPPLRSPKRWCAAGRNTAAMRRKARLYGRKITAIFGIWSTPAPPTSKTACAACRLYPLAAAPLAVVREENVGERMDFDTEILVRLHWRALPLVSVENAGALCFRRHFAF